MSTARIASYDADSIVILTPTEVCHRHIWAQADALALLYPTTTRTFILKLLIAARTAGCDPNQVIKRYLDRDYTVPVPSGLMEAYRAAGTPPAA